MKDGPDLARVGALVGDPARANMLSALLHGGALTASELALEAGVTLPTASSHLAKLVEGGLLTPSSQGRHRYYRLSGHEVAAMLEVIGVVAETMGPRRVRPGPRDKAMREARVCYDHLAGELAVALFDRLMVRGILVVDGDRLALAPEGTGFFRALGIEPSSGKSRRPLCRACLDWSERRSHLAGALGAAVLDDVLARNWARREAKSRAIRFTPPGRRAFEALYLA